MATDLIETPPPTKAYIVRHGSIRYLGEFQAPEDLLLNRFDSVVIQSERGTEIGQVLTHSHPQAIKQIPNATTGTILRKATSQDEEHARYLQSAHQSRCDRARAYVQEHNLAMQIVDEECLFGGERQIFYFLAETRIDFRDLVKSLAKEFQKRIELRQIGTRDEAKLLADYGDCGRTVCCNSHMITMPPVSMRMAKMQKATLDPTKVSGRCGRLKCCLRFEQDVYEEFQAQLPPIASLVVTTKGKGKVLAQEVLARKVLIEFEDGRKIPVQLHEILSRIHQGKPQE